jgi:hypothetical protein
MYIWLTPSTLNMTHGVVMRNKAVVKSEEIVGTFFKKLGFAKLLHFKVFKYLSKCKSQISNLMTCR